MNNAQEIKQLKKDIIKGHAKNKYKNQGVQFTADQVVASLQEEQKAELQDFDKFWDNEQKKEIEKYGDVNQGLGTWNGYEYVKTNGGK